MKNVITSPVIRETLRKRVDALDAERITLEETRELLEAERRILIDAMNPPPEADRENGEEKPKRKTRKWTKKQRKEASKRQKAFQAQKRAKG